MSVSVEFQRLLSLVDAYLAKNDYMALWRAIDGPEAMDREPLRLDPSEEPLWEELHEIVHYGQQEPATPGERRDGLLGGPELHGRLREWRSAALAGIVLLERFSCIGRGLDALPNTRLKLPAPFFCGGHLFVNVKAARRSLSAIR